MLIGKASASVTPVPGPVDNDPMNKRMIATLIGAAVLAVPASAVAESEHKHPGKEMEKGKGKHKRAKKVTFVFKGTFISPGTVEVRAGNAHARRGGFVGEAVTFDFEHAKVVVADTNGDGKRDVVDVADGDRVMVTARMLKRTRYVAPVEDDAPEAEAAGDESAGEGRKGDEPKGDQTESKASGAIVARKLIDRTHPPVEDEDEEPAHDE